MSQPGELRVGLISDTHGLLRTEAREFLTGSDYIIHGGDIGDAEILDQLSLLAPLIVVKGNNDHEPWGRALRETELVRIGGIFVLAVHDRSRIKVGDVDSRVRVVVSGHSHKPSIEELAGVLYVNPGSCGPRRFRLPISIGELRVTGSLVTARTVQISD